MLVDHSGRAPLLARDIWPPVTLMLASRAWTRTTTTVSCHQVRRVPAHAPGIDGASPQADMSTSCASARGSRHMQYCYPHNVGWPPGYAALSHGSDTRTVIRKSSFPVGARHTKKWGAVRTPNNTARHSVARLRVQQSDASNAHSHSEPMLQGCDTECPTLRGGDAARHACCAKVGADCACCCAPLLFVRCWSPRQERADCACRNSLCRPMQCAAPEGRGLFMRALPLPKGRATRPWCASMWWCVFLCASGFPRLLSEAGRFADVANLSQPTHRCPGRFMAAD